MINNKQGLTIGLVGNPNAGKTTIFNGLTGAHQYIGNWPGVTVERKEGTFNLPDGTNVRLVDLPGIYSLMALSEDERAAAEYVMSREADLYINVLDATQLERNLYLTLLLAEFKVPMVIVLTMVDIAKERHIHVDLDHLAAHLGCPVIGVNANHKEDMGQLLNLLVEAKKSPQIPTLKIDYPNELEQEIDILSSACVKTAQGLKVEPRWVAIKALEGDPLVLKAIDAYHDMASELIGGSVQRITDVLKEAPDVIFADTRYGVITGLRRDVVHTGVEKIYFSEKLDRIMLNRILGIPIFLVMMGLVFWLTQTVGGAFIDFFELLGQTIFVDGSAFLLGKISAPNWLIALISDGVGVGLQTVGTFIPPITFMFLCLSILEDSGYMARAAFVMDRFMGWVGLPGKSFVPMLVGFGCSVPAIMATRTLESKRDRLLTIFMIPFMSCGAKLPVYTVFAAAFFAENPGRMVMWIYLCGIALGIVTGLVMKHTLFQGEPSHFIMELPPYHCPRPKHIFLHTWDRLKGFIFRAGKVIVPMVLVLGLLNSRDAHFNQVRDQRSSMLSVVGETMTPIFEPMGVERENWPATVSIFSGLFAKEAVIGTMTSLYGQNEAAAADGAEQVQGGAPEKEAYSFWGGVKEAFATIPENLGEVWSDLISPTGYRSAPGDKADTADSETARSGLFENMRSHFSKGPHQAFAFLLFVLLYVPCVAAMGVAFRELGRFYGTIMIVYLTTLGWSVATLYYQLVLGHQALWVVVPILFLIAMYSAFWFIGKKRRVDLVV